MLFIAKSSLSTTAHNTNAIILHTSTVPLYLLRGTDILNKIINPTIASNMVAAVAISSDGSPNTLPHTTSAAIARASVSPAGRAFKNTFLRNFPSILLPLDSMARKNAGIPILNMLISDICDGSSGYVTISTAANSDISSENIFLTRNRLAERWTLLTTLRPSITTDGICAKSESNKTTWAAWAAASLPELNATLQSASLSASISLTPSPVIATVCPCFFNEFTICFFCLGVTRPNTVYFLTAISISAAFLSFLASIYFSAFLIPAFPATSDAVSGLSPDITITDTP